MLKLLSSQLVSKSLNQLKVALPNYKEIFNKGLLEQQPKFYFGGKVQKKSNRPKEITKKLAMSDDKSAKISQGVFDAEEEKKK